MWTIASAIRWKLRSDSYLGVAGLLDAVRAGSVTVCNALGSGLMETSSFGPFLPGLSRRLLGEELALPSVATWWCGQPKALRYVEDNLKFLVIKPASPSKGMEPVFGGKLSTGEQAKLLAKIQAKPREFVGQELIDISSVPVWSGEALVPRRVVLRVYMAAAGDSWIVMPGGLARVSPAPDAPVVSMQRGGGSKDVWVLSEKPVDNFTLRRPSSQPVELNRGISVDLPSRAVDHLFWFGRYAERCEHLCRVLRCILLRVTGETGASGTLNWTSLMSLYASLDSPHSRFAKDDPQGHLDLPRELEQEVLSLIFEEQRSDSLSANLKPYSSCGCAGARPPFGRYAASHQPAWLSRAIIRRSGVGLCFHGRCPGRFESMCGYAGGTAGTRNGEHDARARVAFSQHRASYRAIGPAGGSIPRHCSSHASRGLAVAGNVAGGCR